MYLGRGGGLRIGVVGVVLVKACKIILGVGDMYMYTWVEF